MAVEYLTAILKLNSKIIPIAIERCDNGFYSTENNLEFLSASSIRTYLLENKNIDKFIPKNAKIITFFDKNHEKNLKILQILKIRNSSPKELERYRFHSFKYVQSTSKKVFEKIISIVFN